LATIKDVAKLAGVSVATVSRVINNNGSVKEATVEAVNDAIRQLDYHPNFLGRTLRRLQTMKIIVMLPTISNPLYSRVVRGIQTCAAQNGFHVMLAIAESKESEDQYIEMLKHRLVDGIIFLHSNMTAKEASDLSENYPIVFACEHIQGADTAVITINNFAAGFKATEFLIQNGCSSIVFLSAGELYYSSVLRKEGYKAALEHYGIAYNEDLIINEGLTFNAGKRAAARINELSALPDAVFSVSDSAAIGLISTLAQQGIYAGEDISVMGFDDNAISEYYRPSLTTISQPQYDIGFSAMDILAQKIGEKVFEVKPFITLPYHITIRESVKLTASQIN